MGEGRWVTTRLGISLTSDERNRFLNRWQLDYLFKSFLKLTTKKTSKPCIAGPISVTKAQWWESIFMSWRHSSYTSAFKWNKFCTVLQVLSTCQLHSWLLQGRKILPAIFINWSPAKVNIASSNGLSSVCQAPSHYLNQCWLFVSWALRNKAAVKFESKYKFFHRWKMHLEMSVKWRTFCRGIRGVTMS